MAPCMSEGTAVRVSRAARAMRAGSSRVAGSISEREVRTAAPCSISALFADAMGREMMPDALPTAGVRCRGIVRAAFSFAPSDATLRVDAAPHALRTRDSAPAARRRAADSLFSSEYVHVFPHIPARRCRGRDHASRPRFAARHASSATAHAGTHPERPGAPRARSRWTRPCASPSARARVHADCARRCRSRARPTDAGAQPVSAAAQRLAAIHAYAQEPVLGVAATRSRSLGLRCLRLRRVTRRRISSPARDTSRRGCGGRAAHGAGNVRACSSGGGGIRLLRKSASARRINISSA